MCIRRQDALLAHSDYLNLRPEEEAVEMTVRFRTIGDMTITGAVESSASTIEDIVEEVATSRVTERNARADDARSEAAMEERKKEGYF